MVEPIYEDMARLHRLLIERNSVASRLQRYYRGAHPMPWVHKKARTAYIELMKQATSNFPQLVVDSLNDRLTVEGFRFEEDSADKEAWKLWQDANLDVFSPMIHAQALVTGYSYVSAMEGQIPKGESCFEVMHESDPGDIFAVRVAMKVWPNKFDKKWYGRYWKDGVLVRMEAPLEQATIRDESKPSDLTYAVPTPEQWSVMTTDDMAESPFVPFVNRPDLDGWGWGEFEDVVPLVDRINTISAQMLLAGELAAFRAKWATGIDIPTDDEGKELEPFSAAMDRLAVSENDTARFGTFDSTDLKQYQDALNQAITHLAAITRTPPFMLLGNLTNLSAEALKATESGLVKKALQRQVSFGESWEKVMRVSLGRPEATDAETIWRDPENVSESQHVDALTKLYTMGLPQKAVWELYGASPQQMERWDAMRSEDVMQRVMLANATKAPAMQNGPVNADQQPQQPGGNPTAQLQQMPNSAPAGQ